MDTLSTEELIRTLESKAWQLHKRLAEPYSISWEAADDMVKLGKIAEAMINLRKGRNQANYLLLQD